jgi:hypothetical protein
MINPVQLFAETCKGGDFLGFPKWYKYLEGDRIRDDKNTDIVICSPRLDSLDQIYLIVAALIEVLLRISALVAMGYVIWGGVEYLMSQGDPDKTARARKTIINALIGLVISITAATVVSFFAGKFNA